MLFLLNSTFRRFKTGIKNIFPDCRRLLQEYVIKQPVKNHYLAESDQNFTSEKVTNQNFLTEVQGYCKLVPASILLLYEIRTRYGSQPRTSNEILSK